MSRPPAHPDLASSDPEPLDPAGAARRDRLRTAALAFGLLGMVAVGIAAAVLWVRSEPEPWDPIPDRGSVEGGTAAPPPTPLPTDPPPGPRREEVPTAPEAGTLDPETSRTLDLLGRTRLFGTVRHADGERVAGARIWWDGRPVATANAEGEYDAEFAWSAVAPGRYGWLYAEDPGVACQLQRAPSRGGRVDFRLQSYGKVQGTVFSERDGQRLVGATVELQVVRGEDDLPARPVMRTAATTDDRGHFTFRGIPAGTLALRAEHPGYESARWYRVESPGSAFDVVLELSARRILQGRFEPWPPAPPHDRGLRVRAGTASGVPDAQGAFRLAMPATAGSLHWLLLECEGGLLFARAGPGHGELGSLPLQAPAYVQGSLLGARPADLQGLEACAVFHRERAVWPEPVRAPLDDEGRFRLGPLPPGTSLVSLVVGTTPIAPAQDLLLVAGETRILPPIQPRSLLLRGVVRDEGGRAIPGVDVAVEHDPDRGAPWKVQTSTRTDAGGAYVLSLALADEGTTRRLVAIHPRRLLPARMESLPSAPGVHRVDLVLRRGRVQRGHVVASDPGGWTVIFDSEDRRSLAVPTTRQDRVDADGTFLVDGLEDREYRVELRDRDGRVRAVQSRRPSSGVWTLTPEPDED